MQKQRFSHLLRTMMVIAILGILISLIGGGASATAAPKQSYIVQATTTELAAQLVEKHGGTITSHLEIIRAVGALLSADGVSQLRLEKGIVAITLNSTVNSSDNNTLGNGSQSNDNPKDIPNTDYPNVVGADLVWQGGVIGSNVAVAVLDTGLGKITGLEKGTDNKPRIVAWKDFVDDSKKPNDPNGHGSHVAGIIANSQQGADGDWNGVAPGVDLVGVRVLNASGVGTYETVILGLQWVIKNRAIYNIRVVNLSLVAPAQSPYWADPLDQAVTQTWASGLTVIVAAGNDGPEPMSISVPGNDPYVVTVGAFTDNFTPADWSDDYITPFSAAGPTLDGFVKPDLIAPGAHMVSVVPADSYLVTQYPDNWIKKSYFKLAGTSQATAVVSGIAALVISKNPALTPNQVKLRLTYTALPWVNAAATDATYSMWQQGSGRANAPDAVFANVTGSANQGMDIQADLAGRIHYEGYSYYDKTTGTYRLLNPFNNWTGKYGAWDGSHGAWSSSHGAWSSLYGAWSGSHGAWSGSHGAWSSGYTTWSGSHGAWSSSHGAWSGGYTAWSGSHGAWSGAEPWAGSVIAQPAFVANFIEGISPDASITNATISYFLQDP
ncbi:MAG: S8 family peptidase [Anaerolineales bacterium]